MIVFSIGNLTVTSFSMDTNIDTKHNRLVHDFHKCSVALKIPFLLRNLDQNKYSLEFKLSPNCF